jgi:hypothetical protein
MARFCGNCGSALEESQAFCGNCGAPAGVPVGAQQAEVTPPAAAAPAPVAAAPVPAAAAPAKGTSPVVKIILVVVAFFAFITVAGIGACVYIGYRAKQRLNETFKVDEGGKGITLKTPKGDIRLGESPGAEGKSIGGIPPYPGATPVNQGGDFSVGGKSLISGQEYTTSDSVEDVVNYYKEQLGPKVSVMESQGKFQLTRADEASEGITIVHVSPNENAEGTKIVVSYMGK